MKQDTIFNNLQELANFWGCDPDEESLSRAVYKGTNCGAWLQVINIVKVTSIERWVAIVNPDSNKVSVQSVKHIKSILDIGNHQGYLDPKDAPEEVRIFLSLDMDDLTNNIMQGVNNFEHLKELIQVDDLRDIVRLKDTQLSFKIAITRKVDRPRVGIRIGTIVEGSDAEPMPFSLFFPFTYQVLEDNLQELEGEAEEIWNEANEA